MQYTVDSLLEGVRARLDFDVKQNTKKTIIFYTRTGWLESFNFHVRNCQLCTDGVLVRFLPVYTVN